jgi:HEAT repeat protein/beta-lactamase regulating signal transducer with metallopeptidase domain
MISFLASLDEWGFPAMRYLLSALWQSSLLFAATFALAYFLRRRRAAVRHAVWALALLMAPTLPLLTRGFERAGAPQMRLTMLPAYHNDEGRMMNDEWKRNISLPGSGVSENTASAKNPGASLAGAETGLETMPRAGMRTIFNYPWALGLIAYAAGLSLFLIWIVLGRLRIRQWIGAAMPATDERVLAAFRHAREALRFHRACLALQSPRVPVPISVGILHSRVLLPSTLAPRLSDEELRAVALHETAHLSRHDPLVLTLAALVRAALFFHPLVWLAARQVSTLAEHCADDAVLDATGRPLPYAEMLARLAEDLPERPFAAEMATGILLSKGAFLRRVEAILGDRDRARRLTRRALAATAAAVLLSIAVALAIPLGERRSGSIQALAEGDIQERGKAAESLVREVKEGKMDRDRAMRVSQVLIPHLQRMADREETQGGSSLDISHGELQLAWELLTREYVPRKQSVTMFSLLDTPWCQYISRDPARFELHGNLKAPPRGIIVQRLIWAKAVDGPTTKQRILESFIAARGDGITWGEESLADLHPLTSQSLSIEMETTLYNAPPAVVERLPYRATKPAELDEFKVAVSDESCKKLLEYTLSAELSEENKWRHWFQSDRAESEADFTAAPKASDPPTTVTADVQREIGSLRSSDPNLRGRGAFLLGEMKEKAAPAIPMLVSLLGDDKQSDFEANGNMHNSHVYDEAATALGKIGVQAIEPLIAKLAEVGSASDKAAEALAHIGEPAVAALTTALKDDNDRVRAKAAGVLARTGGISLENLLQALNDKDQGTRAAVAEGLRWTEDARATKALIDLLNDENSKVRACAASALGRAGNKAAVGPLIGRLNDKDMQVRVNATFALGKIGDKGAVASLLAITRGESEGYRDGAFQALRMIGDPDSAEAVAKLIEASDPGARLESLRTLGDLNHPLAFEAPQSAKPVTDLLLNKKEDPAVRSAAAGTLRLYRDPYAMDALETVLKDNAESEDLRSRAAKSLGRLGTPGIERLMNLEQSNDVELKRLATTGLKEILVTSSYPDARYTLWWEVYMDALREVVGALATPAELDAVAKGPELPLAAAEKHPNPHIRSVAPLVEKIAEEEWDLHPLLRRLGKPNYPDSYPWGEAVNRVQCRLRMRQLDFWEWNRFGGETLWTGDDAPQIKMDIRNQGTLDLNCSVPPSQLRLEVDGVEYGRPRTETPGPQIPLWPGQQRNAFRVVLDKKWLREGKPLVWNAGRHTVRVVVQLNPTAGENFAVYSNPIELETYPSGKERYELQNFRIEAGFVPDRNEIQAGEELGVEFYVRNVGDAAFGLRVGGDGRGVRPTRFKISAVDADGNKVTDPNANAMNMGGFGGCPMIEPGKSYAESLFLSKWCEFVKPGVYTVTCTSVLKISKDGTSDFDERKMLQLPIETRFTLTVKEPAANQAREKVESMLKNRDKADFSILRSPVYLPVLGEYAAKEDGDAVKGIGSIHSPEATKALIALAEDWLKRGKTDLALQAIRPLRSRLPNPGWYPADQSKASGDKYFAPDRERVERTWRAEFAGPMRGMARRLVRNTDQESLETAGYILQCVGTAEDLPDLMIGYTNAIEATKTLPFETHQYFRPRGASYRYRFAAELLIGRGGAVPEKPNTPGEAATYLIAMQAKKDFRPADWPQQVLRWLDYATPYMREFVLDFMPDPIPDAALDKIPALLADPYVDLQIAACHTAQKHPRETFREPLLAILNKGTEQYLLNAAAAAAPANGIPTDQFMEIWVRRMDRNDLGTKAVIRLLLAILDNNQRGDPQDLSAEATAAAQARWKRFIEENREKLRQGKRFKIGDPEITPDLFPPGFSWYKDNKPWPPQNDPSSSAVTGTKRSPGAESVANFTAARKVSDPPTTVTADVQSEPERLVARSAEGVPQEEGMAALEEILKLRETRDAKYVPALEKILEANMDSGRTHGFAAAQALFCIGTPEARSVLDRYLLTPRYNTWLGIRYATYQKMAEPQRSDFVRQYYLKNLSQDLAVELAAAPKWDKEGARIEFTLTLRNSSDKALRILEQQVYPGRMLSFQDEAGRIAPPVEIAVGRLSRTKWVELVPSATHQYTIPVRIRRVDPQGKYPYPGLSPDAELFAETGDLIFDIVRKGRSQVYAMVEAQPPPKAQLEKLDFNNLWTGRAVSKPIEVDISLTPPVRAVSNPDGLSPPAEGKSADKANPGFLADLPEFRDLDTSVTKETLKRMIADKGLRNIWTSEDRVTKTCHVYRGDGENVVVTFRDGKCSGIQRMRKDASYADKLFNGLGKQARSLQVSLRADKKVWKAGEDLALKADVRNAGQEDVAIYQDGNNAWEIEMDGQWYWPTGATTALPALLAPGEKILDISVPPTWIKPLDWRAKSDADPVAGRGKLLTLEPGRHTVRVATYPEMYSVDAEGRPLTLVPSPGRTRRVVRTIQQTPGKPVRAVSNPVEIEVLSAESGAALPQERVRMEGDFAVGRELTLGDHRCGSFREGSSIE